MPEQTSCTSLVIIKHPMRGDAQSGRIICDEIRRKLIGCPGQVCLYHDASGMENADPAYAGAFKELDKFISERVVEVVCLIPRQIPRMMAHTVAMFSDKKWNIFKDAAEAEKYIVTKGYDASVFKSAVEAVTVVKT